MATYPLYSPRYTHSCSTCTFLGTYTTRICIDGVNEDMDLYFCPQGNLPTVIARFGDEGSDYWSGLYSDISVLKEAARLARARGLLKDE